MNENSWRTDFGRLGVLLLPTMLRGALMGKWVRLMMSGVAQMHTMLVDYREQTAYEMRLSGQTCRLRGLLNDKFDSIKRRISIVDVANKPTGTVVYLRSEHMGLPIGYRTAGGGISLERRGFEGIKQPDFEVVIPAAVDADEKQMRGLLNAHKLAGKRYIINKLIN